jgi:hypothetical protein
MRFGDKKNNVFCIGVKFTDGRSVFRYLCFRVGFCAGVNAAMCGLFLERKRIMFSRIIRGASLLIVFSFFGAVLPRVASAEAFLKVGHVRYAGDRYSETDVEIFAKSYYLSTSRFLWWKYQEEHGGNIWKEIKKRNPDIQIMVYVQGPQSTAETDIEKHYRQSIARVFGEDSPPSGSLESNGLLFPTGNGDYVRGIIERYYLARYGSDAYAKFWHEAVTEDILKQPWFEGADGIHIDNCGLNYLSGDPPAEEPYNTIAGMNEMLIRMLENLSSLGHTGKLPNESGSPPFTPFIINPNIVPLFYDEGPAFWKALDDMPAEKRPGILHEEGAFFHRWWKLYPITWLPEDQWKDQIDTMGSLRTPSMWRCGHELGAEGEAGPDNAGGQATHWQALWYAMGSMAMGKQDGIPSYFTVTTDGVGDGYSTTHWFPEYDELDGGKLDMGATVGKYQIKSVGGTNIYFRQFANGWVLINPTKRDSGPVNLADRFGIAEEVRHIRHANIQKDLSQIPSTRNIENIFAHTAVFLRKIDVPTGLEPPKNLQISVKQ